MPLVPSHLRVALAGLALVLGVAPAPSAKAQDARGVEFAPPAPREVDWPHFAGNAPRRVWYAGPWAHVTYGRFLDPSGARAEVVYAVAIDGDHVVDIPFGLRRSLSRWRWLSGKVRDVGPERDVRDRRQRLQYRRFVTKPDGRACVAFMGAWDVRGLDQQARHGKAAFGFYCAAAGRPLDARRIDLLLGQLTFRPADRGPRRALPGGDPAALAFARSGAPGFPFDFGKTVQDGRDDRRRR